MIVKMASLDWLSLKIYHKLLFFTAPWFMFVYSASSMLIIVPLFVIYYSMVSTWLFSVEEKGESHRLYLTLPVKKREIVAGRYFLTFIIFIGSILTGIGVMFIKDKVNFFWFNLVSEDFLSGTLLITVIAVSYLLHALFSLCVFPIFYWLGYTKGKFLGYIIMFSIFFGFLTPVVLYENRQESPIIRFLSFAQENIALVNGIIFITATAILALSYFISIMVYSKRDF